MKKNKCEFSMTRYLEVLRGFPGLDGRHDNRNMQPLKYNEYKSYEKAYKEDKDSPKGKVYAQLIENSKITNFKRESSITSNWNFTAPRVEI